MEVKNKELDLAWEYVANTNVSVFLTGKAGTGKTTFLSRLKEEMPKRMVVVAPTGVAAINANGVTIHSFFQLPIGIHIPGEVKKERNRYFQMSKEKKNIMRTLDLLIIDEISMVRSDLLDAIDSVLRKYKDRQKPFGGVQLLMIGDLQQLAPVANEHEWSILKEHYSTPYFFGSKALQEIQYVTIELKHIYRQSDEHFINLLANIRDGRLDKSTVDGLNQRYIPGFQIPSDSDYIRLTTHNYKAQQYNKTQLDALDSRSHVFQCEVSGTFPDTAYPAESALELKVGAQVMYLKNDTQHPSRYFNGKIGKVVGFGEDCVLVQSAGESRPISVEQQKWDNTEYEIDPETKEIREKVVGEFKQYPLRLAWSITIHKSQGLTFDHAVLDINQSFAHGQVYVALSRCRTLEGLVLSNPLRLPSLLQDDDVNKYISEELSASEQAEASLEMFRRRYYHDTLDELFDFSKIESYTKDLSRVFSEHFYKKSPSLTSEWSEASNQLRTKVIDVAVKFKRQYNNILATNGENHDDPYLQERLHKASEYYFNTLSNLFVDLYEDSKDLPIGNKQVKSRFDNAFERFSLEYKMKIHLLYTFQKEDFYVKSYLHFKAQSLIPDSELKVRRKNVKGKSNSSNGSKHSKEKKESTYDITYRMFQEGKNYNEIALERFLTPNTIFGHLMRFVEAGKIRFLDVVTTDHIKQVREIIDVHGIPEKPHHLDDYQPSGMCKEEFHRIIRMFIK